MNGVGLVFINFEQAARFGHVAWGFQIQRDPDVYYFGSTDHLLKDPWWDLLGWARYAHVPPSNNVDWWSGTGDRSQMIQMMYSGHHIRYHAAKVFEVSSAQPNAALECADLMQHGGWSVLANNCVHQTSEVLTRYGATLPKLQSSPHHLIPKQWFSSIKGDYLDLATAAQQL